jgi:hypothetical protein
MCLDYAAGANAVGVALRCAPIPLRVHVVHLLPRALTPYSGKIDDLGYLEYM